MSTSNTFQELFGNNLRTPTGELVATSTALTDKDVVGIYFSAHWCPPCRRFTPQLSEKYTALKEAGKKIEIVFVSSDSDLKGFEKYHESMSFLGLPYEERDLKATLSKKFKVQGIPTLVFLDSNGDLITDEGRAAISKKNYIEAFPFQPIDFAPVFADWTIFGSAVDSKDLKTKEAVAILIGNGSNATTYVMPKLASALATLTPERLAVIYVPHDVTDQEKESTFVKSMPSKEAGWITLPPTVAERVITVLTMFNKGGELAEPLTMVVSGDSTKIFNKEASRTVYRYKDRGFPWSVEALEAMEEELARKEKEREEKIIKLRTEVLGKPGFKFLKDMKIRQTSTSGFLTVQGQDDKAISAQDYLLGQDLDVVGIYFSAHWCGPCRYFTPQLAAAYQTLKAEGKKFEVIFVSSDENKESYLDYFKSMPWLALDYNSKQNDFLSSLFEVEGIPTLALVDVKTGRVNTEGREAVDFGTEYYPWSESDVKRAQEEQEAKAAAEAAALKAKLTAVEQAWKANGSVVVKNHRELGSFTEDYTLEFKEFNTFLADVKLKRGGKYYYEIELFDDFDNVFQFGFATEGFKAQVGYTGEGVGDDDVSWGFDGVRQQLWPSNKGFGSAWTKGDVLGLACDLVNNTLSLSVNGSFDAPNGVGFEDIKFGDWLSPALTSSHSSVKVNFGQRSFKHSGPDDTYVSVHSVVSTSTAVATPATPGVNCANGVCTVEF